MIGQLGQWLKPLSGGMGLGINALFWPASLSDDAELKFQTEVLKYQGKDHLNLPIYHDTHGKQVDVLTLQSSTFMLPNGIGLTWFPEKPPEIGIEGYPDDPDARQVIIYTTPVTETAGPLSLELPATEGELVILWSPEARQGVPVYYSEGYDVNLSSSQQNSIRSLKKRISEHKQKLEDYKHDPETFDNKEFLKNAPNEQIRQNIIDGRVRHLEQEIMNFEKGIQDILNQKGDN
jgi:hypothetical protein